MNAPDPLVVRCVEKIHRGRGLTKVEDLAKQLKCAPLQLLRSFESGLGASPKQYSQIVRVRLLLEEFLPEMSPRLSDLAQDHGYHDQAHAIHDFKELMGMTPGEFQQEKVNPNVSFHNEVDALVRKLGKSGIPSPPLIERWLMRRVFKSAFIS
jgi:methylphosphotriester-DNA--protein-cysteine methyltransferase